MVSDDNPQLNARQLELLKLVEANGFVPTDRLGSELSVTPQTIRRDINYLSKLKLLKKYHGGAGLLNNAQNDPYTERKVSDLDAKKKIARMVARHIPDGVSLFLNIGTTVEALAAELMDKRNLRIVTNNINIANMLRQNETFDVMIAGGLVRESDGGIVGEATTNFVEQFRLDIGVIGVSGIDEDGTLLDFDYQEIRSAQAIVRNSKLVFLVADASKFGRRAMIQMGDYSDIHHMFTDRLPPSMFMDAINASKMEFHVAPTETNTPRYSHLATHSINVQKRT